MPPKTNPQKLNPEEETYLLHSVQQPVVEQPAVQQPAVQQQANPTQNLIARLLQKGSKLMICNVEALNDDTPGWESSGSQWRMFSQDNTLPNASPLKNTAFLITAILFCATKLVQVMGQTGFSVAQGQGNTAFLIAGLFSNVITTSLTRLRSLIIGLRQILFSPEHSEQSKELQDIERERAEITGFGENLAYRSIYVALTILSLSSILAKSIIGGLSGFILALIIKGYSPEQIHDLKTGHSEHMPPRSDASLWVAILLTALTTGISALCFDYLRPKRARWAIHDYAHKISQRENIIAGWMNPEGQGSNKERASIIVAYFFSVCYAICSIPYAYASLNIALDILPQFFGIPVSSRGLKAIRIGSITSAAVSSVPMMMSAGKDTEQMFKQIFSQYQYFKISDAFKSKLKILGCGKKIILPQTVKQAMMLLSISSVFGLSIIDLYNNTIGIAGSASDGYHHFFSNNGTHYDSLFLGLSTLSTVTYFANTNWLAIMILLQAFDVILGQLRTWDWGDGTHIEIMTNSDNSNEGISLLPRGQEDQFFDLNNEDNDDSSTSTCCCA